jgi:hypothetical protein
VGFKRPTYKLIFEGQLEGFEAAMRGATLGEVVRIQTLLASELMAPANIDDRKEFVELLGSKLISWNLTEDVEIKEFGTTEERPVPATAEQLAKEDWSMVLALAYAWIDAGVHVKAPLDRESSNGMPSGVESIPMEILSESLSS